MLVVVTPSSSTSCSASAASTCGTVTSVPCSDAVPMVATTQLARWNIGSAGQPHRRVPAGRDAERRVGGVVRHPDVRQHRALGAAGGARGVEDLRGVLAVRPRAGRRGVAAGQERVPVVEAHDVPQRLELVRERAGDGVQLATAERLDGEAGDRPRMAQHVAGLGRAQRRVDRDQHHAGERGAVLQHLVAGEVRRPDRDVVAGLVAPQQGAGAALGLLQQLGVGEPRARRGVGRALDQRRPVGRRRARVAQHVADRPRQDGRLGRADGVRRCQPRFRRRRGCRRRSSTRRRSRT